MESHVYKHIEVTGSSSTGTDDAVRNAIAKAAGSVRNIHWFQVVDTRGYVEEGEVKYWQGRCRWRRTVRTKRSPRTLRLPATAWRRLNRSRCR